MSDRQSPLDILILLRDACIARDAWIASGSAYTPPEYFNYVEALKSANLAIETYKPHYIAPDLFDNRPRCQWKSGGQPNQPCVLARGHEGEHFYGHPV